MTAIKIKNDIIRKRKEKDKPQEITIDWQVFHGILEPGKYRIIKDLDDFRGTGDYTKYYFGAEFEILNQAD